MKNLTWMKELYLWSFKYFRNGVPFELQSNWYYKERMKRKNGMLTVAGSEFSHKSCGWGRKVDLFDKTKTELSFSDSFSFVGCQSVRLYNYKFFSRANRPMLIKLSTNSPCHWRYGPLDQPPNPPPWNRKYLNISKTVEIVTQIGY
jgi:hypothetical protein